MKLRHLVVSILLSVLFVMPTLADEAFEITNFNTEIKINQNSTLDVVENILVNFKQNKHGIFRDIQTKGIKIKVVGVTDENNAKYQYDKQRYSEGTRLKIGDPDSYVNGNQTYNITYKVKKAIRFFDAHDELYWNATGNAWPTTINKASATVILPEGVSEDKLQFKCYAEARYSNSENCTYSYDASNNRVTFKTNSSLAALNGLTIVVGLPKGVLIKPTEISDYWWHKGLVGLVILIALAIALEPVYTFWKKGRDPKGRGSIMPEYEAPDDLCPAEVGTLVDEKVHMHDLSATIVDLAVRGYLKIKVLKDAKGLVFKKDDYELVKIEHPKPRGRKCKELTKFEEKFMQAIFQSANSKKISDLTNNFYKELPDLKKSLYGNLAIKKYFPKSPNKVRNQYFAKGGIILSLFFIGSSLVAAFLEPMIDNYEILGTFSIFLSIGIVLNGILSLAFASFMPRKTKKGVLARESILGLKHYMSIAEKDRLKFQEKQNIFYELLPYAMALQVVGKWSKAFEGVFKNPPEWYEGDYTGMFHATDFANGISTMSGSLSTAFASHPSSSAGSSGFSGGFSGGGFGGGGGGSW